MEFDDKNNIIIYQDDNGVPKVNVRFADTDVWLTQQPQVATRFRRWATERLHEYIQKVFAIDDECNFLKTILTKIASVPPMPHQPHQIPYRLLNPPPQYFQPWRSVHWQIQPPQTTFQIENKIHFPAAHHILKITFHKGTEHRIQRYFTSTFFFRKVFTGRFQLDAGIVGVERKTIFYT